MYHISMVLMRNAPRHERHKEASSPPGHWCTLRQLRFKAAVSRHTSWWPTFRSSSYTLEETVRFCAEQGALQWTIMGGIWRAHHCCQH